MVNKSTLTLFCFLSTCSLFPKVAVGQALYTGITAQNQTGSQAIKPDALVAAYDFETYTNQGRLKDFGPHAFHGSTLRNLDTLGLSGQARKFTTLTDVVVLPDHQNFNLNGPITVATWLKLSTPNMHQHILACNDKFVLWTTSKNQFRFADTIGNGFTTLEGTADTDGWHSVVAVWSGTKGDALSKDNIKIFIDGVQMDGTFETSWSPGNMKANNACAIGSTLHGTTRHQNLPFEGIIDELQLYNRAFSLEEIKAHATRVYPK